ncbi:hypothetical protein U14_03917 [Candidatus Moduliflexus flocculans]|uniref:Uncharacterized protein n=1 Tax=Candidatus Moduliflexus flocculans TaxID=1499966 RepID=A0A081BQJ8_9BACT|nr:hypothetical protein U14_03917 [Candidatus Moduliflexus flocculans]
MSAFLSDRLFHLLKAHCMRCLIQPDRRFDSRLFRFQHQHLILHDQFEFIFIFRMSDYAKIASIENVITAHAFNAISLKGMFSSSIDSEKTSQVLNTCEVWAAQIYCSPISRPP